MSVRVLPDFLINQIAAGEVVERPASVVKELVENALDAGADQIVIDIADGGRTRIDVIDNGSGMTQEDLVCCVQRHATSKLPTDDLLNINFMGFRGEALPSIASVSDMQIDTCAAGAPHGWRLDATTMDLRPSDWETGTRIRVQNLFARTPARLKFLRADRSEAASVLETVKRLAMARADVGFTLNNKWRFPKNQDMLERIVAVMGEDVRGRMLSVDATSESNAAMTLTGFISHPTLRRASSVDQYLFVNGRPVKDKVLVGALRAAYMDVMHAREFPLCALYLTVPPRNVDVNVSPAKTDVHFLEPSHVRAFIIKALRNTLAMTLNQHAQISNDAVRVTGMTSISNVNVVPVPRSEFMNLGAPSYVAAVHSPSVNRDVKSVFVASAPAQPAPIVTTVEAPAENLQPLGRVIGQVGNKYILAQSGENLIVIDQHAAHERITYERLRENKIHGQPLLTPIVVSLRPEDAAAVLDCVQQMKDAGLHVDAFGDDAVAIFEKPADWDLDWADLFHVIAAEVRANGHSSQLNERLHLKLANYACHHSVRAGQKLDYNQMDALLRDIERTPRAGECNHGRPVYKIIPLTDIDGWFERI